MTSSDAQRLLAAFDSGELVRPSPDVLNLVDLARATASLAGADSITLTAGGRHLVDLIGSSEHLVFILADGFGMNFLETMDSDAFAPRHLAGELRTVFPSTTATTLTTLATGGWPVKHAVLGWFLYLPEVDAVTTILPFIRRSDGTSLTELGVTPERAFPLRPVMSLIQRKSLSLFPDDIAGSVYSTYCIAGTPGRGYRDLKCAVDEVITRLDKASEPTITYMYWPKIDGVCHELGTGQSETTSAIRELDRELQRLSFNVPRATRIVVTADHGLLDVNESQTLWIEPGDAIASCLSREPSGDSRVVYFSLKDGQEARFRVEFARRCDGRFVLLTTGEALGLGLFGPGTPSSQTRERLGDLVAVSLGADVMRFRYPRPNAAQPPKIHVSNHSGLTPDEMRIPLILI